MATPGAAPGGFPPDVVVQVKALACELPARYGAPLARWTTADLAAATRASGLVATISTSTVWRWLHADAIRPWQHRCWIFPRDPDFAVKAGRILDLYAGGWEGQALRDDAYSGDVGRPVWRDVGHAFRRKPAGAERRWAFSYLSHVGGGVNPARVFRSDPPVSVS